MINQAITANGLLSVLSGHIGRENAIHADHLVVEITGSPVDMEAKKRRLRHCVENLRRDGHHLCGHPSTGYYIAASQAELDQTCLYLYQRSITGLTQIAAMKRVALPDLKGQLRLDTQI